VSKNKKARKVGRPKLPKEHVHGRIIPVRFKNDDLKHFSRAARANKQTLSEWIRANLRDAVQE
jgi:hypothetical protein